MSMDRYSVTVTILVDALVDMSDQCVSLALILCQVGVFWGPVSLNYFGHPMGIQCIFVFASVLFSEFSFHLIYGNRSKVLV